MSFIINEDEFKDKMKTNILSKFGKNNTVSNYILSYLNLAAELMNKNEVQSSLELINTIQAIIDGKEKMTALRKYKKGESSGVTAVAGKGKKEQSKPEKLKKSYGGGDDQHERTIIKDAIKQALTTTREINPDYIRSKLESDSVDAFDHEYNDIISTIINTLEKFDTIPTTELQQLRKDIVAKVNFGLRKKADMVKTNKLQTWSDGSATKAKELNTLLATGSDDFDAGLGLSTEPTAEIDPDTELDALAADKRMAMRERLNDLFNLLDEDEDPLDFGDVQDTVVADSPKSSSSIRPKIQTFNWKAIEIPYEDQKDKDVKVENMNKNLSQEIRNIKFDLNRILQDQKTVKKLAKEFIDNTRPNKRNPTLSLANSGYNDIQKMNITQKYDEFLKYIIGLIYVKAFKNPTIPMTYLKERGLTDENVVIPKYIAFRILDVMRGSDGYKDVGKSFMEVLFPTGQA